MYRLDLDNEGDCVIWVNDIRVASCLDVHGSSITYCTNVMEAALGYVGSSFPKT